MSQIELSAETQRQVLAAASKEELQEAIARKERKPGYYQWKYNGEVVYFPDADRPRSGITVIKGGHEPVGENALRSYPFTNVELWTPVELSVNVL